jgi:hypothetical protein
LGEEEVSVESVGEWLVIKIKEVEKNKKEQDYKSLPRNLIYSSFRDAEVNIKGAQI